MKIEAPWSPNQVAALNEFQQNPNFHPYTSEARAILIATEAGWVEYQGGPVIQTWAHDWTIDAALRQRLQV